MRCRAFAAGSGIALTVMTTVGATAIGYENGTALESTASPRAHGIPVADCRDSGQTGRGRLRRPDRKRDLIAGPLALRGLRVDGGPYSTMPELFEPQPGERYAAIKTPALVKAGTAVTITIPESERAHVKVGFKGIGFGPAATLKACRRGSPERRARNTGFAGGFKVTGTRCSELRVRVHGREGPPLRRHVSFGAGPCPAE